MFEASYTPNHPALLNVALSEIRSVLKSVHNLIRCLFYTLPKQGGKEDLHIGSGVLVLPSFFPRIYSVIQGMVKISGSAVRFAV